MDQYNFFKGAMLHPHSNNTMFFTKYGAIEGWHPTMFSCILLTRQYRKDKDKWSARVFSTIKRKEFVYAVDLTVTDQYYYVCSICTMHHSPGLKLELLGNARY
jgi:hypothetical protein